jgi:putative hydrolase of the HAD superfamily
MIRAIISDLGNVLLHFDHRIIARRFSERYPEARSTETEMARFWMLVQRFETGAIAEGEFISQAAQGLGVRPTPSEQEFAAVWNDIFWPNDALLRVFEQLRERVTLIMLSNTNPLHIAYARARFPEVFSLFHHTVFSYECGRAKPDARMFAVAVDHAGVAPDEVLYFDDIAEYVDAATETGMHAYQYVSVPALVDMLRVHEVPVTHPDSVTSISDQ